ncbi:MAG: class I SAM-dependent methyltransferase [Xenococcaceae cyanobacterium]
MQQTSNPDLWNRVWSQSSQEESDREFWEWVNRESTGVRGTKIQNYIRTHLGDLRGLKTIEVGSGPGIYSFIFARLGAQVTLLDYSDRALSLAKQRFEAAGLSATFWLQDALKLDPGLHSQYDVAMSFGTVEHFRYPQRLQMIEAHVNLVRAGGAIAVSTPNQSFFPHELLKAYLQSQNKWQLGYEGAFSRAEFFKVARTLNLIHPEVIGSAFLSDFQRYIRIYRSTNVIQKLLGEVSSTSPIPERSSWLDNFLGADLVLLGIKN